MSDDRVLTRPAVRRRAVPAGGPAGAARDPARRPAARGPAADRQGRRRPAGDQPEHGAQGLPGAGARRPRHRPARGRHVRHPDARRPHADGLPAAEPRPAPLAGQGPRRRTRRREHRGPVREHAARRCPGGNRMSTVLRADGLGKRYGRRWALTDCTLEIEPGHVTGLVGPNGAGKSTLLNLAVGLLAPTTGTIEVCGGRPADDPEQLALVGFVAQDTPTYATLSVADHLRLGARLNPRWDDAIARARIAALGLDPRQRVGKLSGGQRAQLALTLALAKRPELLVLDEPVASLDPLARREFLQVLMEAVAEHGISVVLSSHLVADLERVCDHVVVLVDSRVRLAGDGAPLLATHPPPPPPGPARAAPRPRCPPVSRSSRPARPSGRAPSSCARTSRCSTPP